jgi:hypothetical protein
MDWCEPRDFRDWIQRCFSLRTLVFLLAVLLTVALEFRFDWMERALGAYLSRTNQKRPETGVIWDDARHAQQARDLLDEIATDRGTAQRNARSSENLAEIISQTADNKVVWVSQEHFRSLYLKLPNSIASQIISPVELAQLFGEGRWDRTYIQGFSDQRRIYLIGRDNQVLREINVPAEIVMQIERSQNTFAGSLEEWGAIPERIYATGRFFTALNSLPDDVRANVLSQPERIINAGGRLVRVGLLKQAQTQWVDIGFEFEDGGQRRVIVQPAREGAVERLRLVLESMPALTAPASPGTEDKIPQ